MIKLLRPFIALQSDETVLSWANRLARRHTAGRITEFLNDIGIRALELARGSREAILRLCEVTGQEPTEALHNGPVANEYRQHLVRGESISSTQTTKSITKFCPICLGEDETRESCHDARRHRWAWRIRPIYCCPIHDVLLMERQGSSWQASLHELPVIVPENRAGLTELGALQPQIKPSALQSYLHQRLLNGRGNTWLDQLSLDHIIAATEIIGATLLFGPKARMKTLNALDHIKAADTAWPYVSRGPEGLRAAFTEMKSAANPELAMRHHRRGAAYGATFRWCNQAHKNALPNPVTDILRQHILEVDDVAPGETLLGQLIDHPKTTSLNRLVKSNWVEPRAVKLALHKRKLISQTGMPETSVLIDRDIANEIAMELLAPLPLTDTLTWLDISEAWLQAFIDTGALSWHEPSVSLKRSEVVALLARISSEILRPHEVPTGLRSLRDLAPLVTFSPSLILTGISDGYLTVFQNPTTRSSLGGLLVRPDDLLKLPNRIPIEKQPFWL